MTYRLLILTMVASVLSTLRDSSFAQEKKGGPPDEKAIMEAMIKAATPGKAHKKLNHFEGSWDAAVKFWMDPSKPPTESKATAEIKWILGGRYLEEKVAGQFFGMKFEGISISGYDNTAKKYHASWFDNMGTGVESFTGKLSEDGKTLTYEGESLDPFSGKMIKGRNVTKILDKDKHVTEMFKVIDLGGKSMEIKVMEITYTRKK